MVTHGHIHVNGRRVDIPSFRVRPGDLISVAPKAKETAGHQERADLQRARSGSGLARGGHREAAGQRSVPSERDQIDLDIREQLIVELYSKIIAA